MKLLEGKVAIVTGAARNRKAIAMRFAEEGASVVFTDLKVDENFQNTEKVAGARRSASGQRICLQRRRLRRYGRRGGSDREGFRSHRRTGHNAGITRDGLMMRMSEQQGYGYQRT